MDGNLSPSPIVKDLVRPTALPVVCNHTGSEPFPESFSSLFWLLQVLQTLSFSPLFTPDCSSKLVSLPVEAESCLLQPIV